MREKQAPDADGRNKRAQAEKNKHIFISHSSYDDAVGRRLCAWLESKDILCWYSSRPADLDPGVEWDDNIVTALDESAAVLLLFSKASNASRWVKREMALAGKRELPVIPLRMEAVQPSGGMEAHLITVQWTDLNLKKWDESLAPIVKELRRIMAGDVHRQKPPPKTSGEQEQHKRRILPRVLGAIAAVALTAAAAALAGYAWMTYKPQIVDKPPPQVTTEIKVCVGEYQRNCLPHDVYLYCGADVAAWAKTQCRSSSVARRDTRGGNKCGYALDSVLCTRDAPK